MKKSRFEKEIRKVVASHPMNVQEDGERYFEEPLFGYSKGSDPLYLSYKTLIGPWHKTPSEAFADSFGEAPEDATVISWCLPISKATRKDQRKEDSVPCRRWARTRDFGQAFNNELARIVVAHLASQDIRAVAPFLSSEFRNWADEKAGWTSNWSERHAAFAGGLGTFSLTDALITEEGIAHRLGSVVAEVRLKPTKRKKDHKANCLFLSQGKCGKCIKRCPAGALSKKGHDKEKCYEYCYNILPGKVAAEYGVSVTGCGLCQTDVPCEKGIPKGL